MVQLEEWQGKFAALGVQVAAMTYDAQQILADFHAAQSLSYPLLKDEDAEHVIALGIINQDYVKGDRAYGIPHPGIMLIGADGVIKAKYAVPGYRSRPAFDMLYTDVKALTQ